MCAFDVAKRDEPDRLSCEVLGYRQWKVNADMRLSSAVISTVWEPGVNEAHCAPEGGAVLYQHFMMELPPESSHDAPQKGCHCGFYALHKPTFWYDEHDSYLSAKGDQAVSGLVAGWGRVEVHHEGFRAQYARVVAIAAPKDKRGALLARAVADEYGVPCVPRAELERVASEFGNPVPEDMRPKAPERPKEDPFQVAGRGGFVSQGYAPVGSMVAFSASGMLGNAVVPAGQIYTHTHRALPPSRIHTWTWATSPTPKPPRWARWARGWMLAPTLALNCTPWFIPGGQPWWFEWGSVLPVWAVSIANTRRTLWNARHGN